VIGITPKIQKINHKTFHLNRMSLVLGAWFRIRKRPIPEKIAIPTLSKRTSGVIRGRKEKVILSPELNEFQRDLLLG